MAKKPKMTGLFDKTESEAKTDDPIESWGVGMKASEWRDVEKIAAELGTSRHKIAAYGLRYFLSAYHEGKIKPETKKTQTLPGL